MGRWFLISTAQGAFLLVALAGLLVAHYGLRAVAHSIRPEDEEDSSDEDGWEDDAWSEDPEFGVTRSKAEPVGRNDPCPCGSGRKYKKCCATPSHP